MRFLFIILFSCFVQVSLGQGIPFIRNYTAEEYGGHNQNFDVLAGNDGMVYVANFEGLLYYDKATWRIIHTPGITRITSVFRDSKGIVWTGGYNYIGHLRVTRNGDLALQSSNNQSLFTGEVTWIWEKDGVVYFLDSNKNTYSIKNDRVAIAENVPLPERAPYQFDGHFKQVEHLEDGIDVLVTDGDGLLIINDKGEVMYSITEKNGLSSNNISHISYDGRGKLWGATDKGVFAIQLPSIYTHFSQGEGLFGEVISIEKLGSTIYVGTADGLYYLNDKNFILVNQIKHACWQLKRQGDNLLAASANGVYRISLNGNVQQLSTANTSAVMADEDKLYCGEMDGLYVYENGTRRHICDAEKVVKIIKDKTGAIWIQNLYGRVWKKEPGKAFVQQVIDKNVDEIATLVEYQETVIPISPKDTKPFPFPLYSYYDANGNTWLTDNKGRNPYCIKDGVKQKFFSDIVYPLMDFSVRAMLVDNRYLWMGGDKGLNVIDCSRKDPLREIAPKLHIRSIYLHGDSLLWGGFGKVSSNLAQLSHNDRHITINYSIEYSSLLLKTQYRYRLNGGKWSAWDNDTWTEYNDLSYGRYVFEVQARDAFGQLSEIDSVKFQIHYPFYLRWYMLVLYLILGGAIIYMLLQLRLRRLEKEKVQLENIVQERTAEVVKQKNEIEEKSKSLETALQELGEAQHELVRQEKMATVGKLTQGLIDRILNPLNYINNFSKLSEHLVEDVIDNIEDEKEHMDQDNYEDTVDILGMLKGNLNKVSEHGQNTTLTLKAMEEMLKDHTGGISKTNLKAILLQNEKMTGKYYEKEINEYHISVFFQYPDDDICVKANAEHLSKCFMSMLGNAIYAVTKKAKRESFHPEVSMTASLQGNKIHLRFKDNGIGIEETIINKIFDPFFTTKTTGEAAGTGLYISREIIQNYGGDITVQSEKNKYTEFTITLPIL